ncbi:undecaprenyl-diphosphate phosphatase [Amnibacterium sp. CER49]|uniref:undecaprenyl-diphosphate phosphatase n=1 Tax=Amnibacterium sp. CER49 TaxID=3039161 RepID=UPI00244D0CB5|nr:undecaprenyl-diphosphate phosphatase [Amnibacterium sp. CER49]MDH2443749.1 undecaprenyl-diphosphate phosphatase [Amnibacterium sp. CER49]
MNLISAVILGIVEGLTEFLPVSSTGHLTIVEKLLGLKVDDVGVTAFTAIIQIGAIIAAIVYFRRDIVRIITAWVRGLRDGSQRSDPDYRLAWYVIIGTIPIGVIGLAARHLISGPLRSLWVVAGALILWSVVMFIAERVGTKRRGEADLTLRDAIVIGLMQCIALIPGVSRSGATISAGLFRGLDRLAATRISFFLGIPALVAAGAFEAATAAKDISHTVGWGPTAVATVVSFIVGYVSIAWLLRLVVRHPISVFIAYRVLIAVLVIGLLLAGVITAT